MPFDRETRRQLLEARAAEYSAVALDCAEREYPHMPWLVIDGPGPLPSHRALHPAFFGSFDWHSCVEMQWAAVRCLRLVPERVDGAAIRQRLGSLLTPQHLETERAFFDRAAHRSFERPYGWGWLLTLQRELERSGDPVVEDWAASCRPLAERIAELLIEWLPRLGYPQRTGVHQNTAFGLLRALDYAEQQAANGQPALLEAIRAATERFFLADRDYPAHYEPSGADFLSAALSEAELVGRMIGPDRFASWLTAFLPALGATSDPLATPATVGDTGDGQLAHLVGLNMSRAASLVHIAESLPAGDARIPALTATAERHALVALPSVTGDDYMVEHWLAAYAVLVLS